MNGSISSGYGSGGAVRLQSLQKSSQPVRGSSPKKGHPMFRIVSAVLWVIIVFTMLGLSLGWWIDTLWSGAPFFYCRILGMLGLVCGSLAAVFWIQEKKESAQDGGPESRSSDRLAQ